jgi:hypothetical protein
MDRLIIQVFKSYSFKPMKHTNKEACYVLATLSSEFCILYAWCINAFCYDYHKAGIIPLKILKRLLETSVFCESRTEFVVLFK